jgi:hypothetical protein
VHRTIYTEYDLLPNIGEALGLGDRSTVQNRALRTTAFTVQDELVERCCLYFLAVIHKIVPHEEFEASSSQGKQYNRIPSAVQQSTSNWTLAPSFKVNRASLPHSVSSNHKASPIHPGEHN